MRPPFGHCWVCNHPASLNLCCFCASHIESVFCLGVRIDALQQVIGSYKFSYARAGGVLLAELMAKHVHSSSSAAIVPVPTQQSHIRARGYDHMAIVGQQISRLTGAAYEPALRSTGHHTQHKLDRKARQEAVKGAFIVNRRLSPALVYMVVDDIVTTGATIIEAVQCLRQAGARRVRVLVAARQVSTERPLSVKIGNVAWRGDRVV